MTLEEIMAIAKKQREGAYTPQSDAMTALLLIEELARFILTDSSYEDARDMEESEHQ